MCEVTPLNPRINVLPNVNCLIRGMSEIPLSILSCRQTVETKPVSST